MANNMVTPVVLNENDDYFNSLPPGFHFVPTDEELILCYLRKKLLNEAMPINRILHLNIYQYHPRDLTARYDDRDREKECYFFTPITRKYVNSSRPNRVAQNGFWMALGPKIGIKDRKNNEVVGYRMSLRFHEGKYPNVNKTEWIMHEYKINAAILLPNTMFDNCVLCKIYKSTGRIKKNQNRMRSQLEHPIDRNAAGSTSVVGPSNTTITTGDDQQLLPVQNAMEHEPDSNLEVQHDGSSDSRQQEEEEDGDWLIVGVEHLSISSDPMIYIG